VEAGLLEPPASRDPQLVGEARHPILELPAKKVGEQLVISVPRTYLVEGDQEQAAGITLVDESAAVLQAGKCIAQFRA
jgi:hypothetical protein